MGEKSKKNSIGFECNPYSLNFCDEIYKYYKGINFDTFINNCDKELNEILKEYYNGAELIKKIF